MLETSYRVSRSLFVPSTSDVHTRNGDEDSIKHLNYCMSPLSGTWFELISIRGPSQVRSRVKIRYANQKC